jgi:hypothetical protein
MDYYESCSSCSSCSSSRTFPLPAARTHTWIDGCGKGAPTIPLIRLQPLLRHSGIEQQLGRTYGAPTCQQCGLYKISWAGRQAGDFQDTVMIISESVVAAAVAAYRLVKRLVHVGSGSSYPPAGNSLLMSPLRVSPRVSWASSTVRSSPARPLMSKFCTGARL